MRELRLIAVSEDGSFAILDIPGRGGRFSLPIDDRLRTVARGQFSRLAQYEIEVESPLRPKEIQDRIRAGEKADEIADAAGVPIERVRRFEGPVLAEREYQAQEAQRVTVRSHGDAGPGPRLGDVVTERLAGLGASADDTRWDSRKRPDGNWQVRLDYALSGRPQHAEWVFDPRSRHVSPADDQAKRLCLAESEWPAPPPSDHGTGTATVTPIGSRLAQAHQPDPGSDQARQPAHGAAASAAGPGGTYPAGARPAGRHTAATGSAEPGPAGPPPASGRSSAPDPRAAAAADARDRQPDSARSAAGHPAPEDQPPQDQPREDPATAERAAAPARPARKAAGGKSRRASVPSWDEIMFGNSRQPD